MNKKPPRIELDTSEIWCSHLKLCKLVPGAWFTSSSRMEIMIHLLHSPHVLDTAAQRLSSSWYICQILRLVLSPSISFSHHTLAIYINAIYQPQLFLFISSSQVKSTRIGAPSSLPPQGRVRALVTFPYLGPSVHMIQWLLAS